MQSLLITVFVNNYTNQMTNPVDGVHFEEYHLNLRQNPKTI